MFKIWQQCVGPTELFKKNTAKCNHGNVVFTSGSPKIYAGLSGGTAKFRILCTILTKLAANYWIVSTRNLFRTIL